MDEPSVLHRVAEDGFRTIELGFVTKGLAALCTETALVLEFPPLDCPPMHRFATLQVLKLLAKFSTKRKEHCTVTGGRIVELCFHGGEQGCEDLTKFNRSQGSISSEGLG